MVKACSDSAFSLPACLEAWAWLERVDVTMELPEASDYMLNVEELDRDHAELFRIIQELQAAFRCGNERHVHADIVERLESYVNYHFDHESQLMSEIDFPAEAAQAHMAEHDYLLKRIQQWRREADSWVRTSSTAAEIIGYIQAWMQHHIKGLDVELARCLLAKDSAQPHGVMAASTT